MNPCNRPNCCESDCGPRRDKRQIAVAVVKSSTGASYRIELITVADLVHLFALAMGYRPDIAFAFGVISRSVHEVQAGECDVDVETAKKSIRIAELISTSRETASMPEDIGQVEAILSATAHVHTVEQAYSELVRNVEGIEATFAEQYNDWYAKQDRKETARKVSKDGGFIARFLRWCKSGSPSGY